MGDYLTNLKTDEMKNKAFLEIVKYKRRVRKWKYDKYSAPDEIHIDKC